MRRRERSVFSSPSNLALIGGTYRVPRGPSHGWPASEGGASMGKRIGVFGTVFALVALLVGAVSPAFGTASDGSAAAPSGDGHGHTIRVTAVFKEVGQIDVGDPGFSLGDEVIFSGVLRQGGERVGR